MGEISGLGRSPGGRYGNPFWYSCLENPQGQMSLLGYSPWGCKESDKTEPTQHAHMPKTENKAYAAELKAL